MEAPENVSKALVESSVVVHHQTDRPGPLGAISRLPELTNGRYGRMSQIEQVNTVAMFAASQRPGGCALSRREHTASGHIAVAGLIRKRRQRRAHGAGSDRYGTLRLQLPPRFKDAEQERSDELLARCCWHHLFERSGSTVSAPRSVAVVLTRQLLAPGPGARSPVA